jgi:hypothetical protein
MNDALAVFSVLYRIAEFFLFGFKIFWIRIGGFSSKMLRRWNTIIDPSRPPDKIPYNSAW